MDHLPEPMLRLLRGGWLDRSDVDDPLGPGAPPDSGRDAAWYESSLELIEGLDVTDLDVGDPSDLFRAGAA